MPLLVCQSQVYINIHYLNTALSYAVIYRVSTLEVRFMKFIFSALYRVTQNVFYARQYTSMWAPVVARQISK
jgi:hypothetical protein